MRYRRVRIDSSILIHLITKGNEVHVKCLDGLPKGTKFAYVVPHFDYTIWIVVEHEFFDDLKEGQEIPIHAHILLKQEG